MAGPNIIIGADSTGDSQGHRRCPAHNQGRDTGNVIGNVANSLDGQGTITYVATGNMGMNWNFAQRSGDLQISHFDTPNTGGLSLGGTLTMPSQLESGQIVPTGLPNQFSGGLSSSRLSGLTGSATGSFVASSAPGAIPNGVIGNWSIATGDARYGAVGIFAGKK